MASFIPPLPEQPLRHLGRPPHPLVRLFPTKERRELGLVLAGQECLTRQWMLRQINDRR